MLLKEIITLKNQKNVYVVENEEGTFLYRKVKTYKYSIALECRRRNFRKHIKLNPIFNVR